MRRGLIATLTALSALTTTVARAETAGERAAATLLKQVADSPTALRIFLKPMPKGGDLHNHLGGSVWAEDYLRWAAEAGLCASEALDRITPPPCPPERTVRQLGERDSLAYDRLIDALSTRGWQQGVGANDVAGHSQFFSSFERFGPDSDRVRGGAMAVTLQNAAGDRVGYVELIHNPPALIAATLVPDEAPLTVEGLAAFYRRESAAITPVVDQAIVQLDRTEAAARKEMACDGKDADAGCAVAVRYLAWGWRDLPPAQAFRSLILAFALADRHPRYVGINIVQPEDWVIALRDYDLHMAMIRFLGERYPRVHRTLHAGELAFGRVPPAALRDHIRKAIDAGAQRIGHGTAIALEDDALATMGRMANKGIAVEINLTSNAVILGVKGADHPLALYRKLGVPVALSTDDEGILRTDMTQEYARAVREQGLGYADLKAMARASLEYAFVAGDSIWEHGRVGAPVAACAPSLAAPSCKTLIARSEKASLQFALEEQYRQFEELIVPAQAKMLGGTHEDKSASVP